MRSHLIHILPFFFIASILFLASEGASAQKNAVESLITSLKAAHPGDSVSGLQVRNIFIEGNKHTKGYIILREMEVKPGNSIPAVKLADALEKDRERIYNTTLFVEVIVEPVLVNDFTIDIKIAVKERWYIFPLPALKIIDGNLNKWLAQYKGDLKRINYGLKFTHYNLTGRRDKLTINLLNGYTKTISFNYRAPYSNPALTNGFSIGGGYMQNREMAYKTSYDNQFVYYKRSYFVKNMLEISMGYSIRKGLKISHQFNLNYSHIRLDDSIVSPNFNKAYFNKPRSKVGFADLYYTVRFTDVNNVLYPLTGQTWHIGAGKRGFGFSGGINAFSVDAEMNKFWSLGKKWYASTQIHGNIKLPFTQPYINQQAMGYQNNYVRGFDYKIIDGVAFAFSKFNLKRELFNFNVNTVFKKSKTLNKIPFRIYAKTFADMGYSYNKDEFVSRLNNRFLGSAGVGIDIVTLYDVQVRIEYSINHLGQKGLFLHNEKGF